MSKITLQDVTNLQTSSAVTTINSNSSIVETAMDNTLSRDGTSPNQMGANLDMNSNRILNLPAASTDSEPIRLAEFNAALFSSGSGGGGSAPNHSVAIGTGATSFNGVTLTNGQLVVGRTGLDPAAATMNGDATLNSSGSITVTKTSGVNFAASATTDTTNAGNISAGTLPAARMPALTSDVTSVANTTGTTVAAIHGTTVSGVTGTGNVVFSSSPTLAGPTLGNAIATTVNRVTITQPASSSTLTINDGKTLTAGNTLTFVAVGGTDGTTQTFPSSSGTVINSTSTAGGDLSGTYPNPTVAKVAGVTFPSSPSANTVASVNSSGGPVVYQSVNNAVMSSMAAWTFKGNMASTSAAPTNFTIDGLTLKGSPAGPDEVILWDVAGSAVKKATVSAISVSAGVSSLNGQTGGMFVYGQPGGRITLTTGLPVLQSSVSGATTVYYTPARHSWILIYDGTNFIPTTFNEVSQATTDAAKSPLAVAANKNYDLFVWNDTGTIRCTRGGAWSSDTSRGAGNLLTLQNGIYLNTSNITNGPGALRGTYVGTIRSNGSSTIDFIYGSNSSGGTAASLGVWNMYNRVLVGTAVIDSAAVYTYSSASIRSANNSTGNRISFITGIQEDSPRFSYISEIVTVSSTSAFGTIGIGLDSTSALAANSPRSIIFNVGATGQLTSANINWVPTISLITNGWHFAQALESSDGTNSNSFNNNSSAQISMTYMM